MEVSEKLISILWCLVYFNLLIKESTASYLVKDPYCSTLIEDQIWFPETQNQSSKTIVRATIVNAPFRSSGFDIIINIAAREYYIVQEKGIMMYKSNEI